MPRCEDADDVKKHLYEWKDPEGVVRFDAVDEMDNAWGNEEFISLQEAMTEHRLLVHHLQRTKTFIEQEIDESTGEIRGEVEVQKEVRVPSLVFQCRLTIHSFVDFSNQPLTKMVLKKIEATIDFLASTILRLYA